LPSFENWVGIHISETYQSPPFPLLLPLLLPDEPAVAVVVAVFVPVVLGVIAPALTLQALENQLPMELRPWGFAVQAFGQTLAPPPVEKGATLASAQKHD
jgi:hypothetical protein